MERRYLERLIEQTISDKLESKGCVAIEGPKWCGKSTTAKRFARTVVELQKKRVYEQYRALADLDEKNLLKGEKPLMFDEWQKIPDLWDYIRADIDETNARGQYILTGSARPVEDKGRHSGTGRIVKIIMRTMSLWESNDSTGEVSLSDLFEGKHKIYGKNNLDLDRIAYLVCRGGWPAIIFDAEKKALEAAIDYVDSLVTEDITNADDIRRNPARARSILKAYSRNISAPARLTTIQTDVEANDASVDKRTVDSYLTAFEKLYVIEEVESWSPRLRSATAIRTSNVRQLSDPSIAAAALGIAPRDLIADLNTFGLFFESLCVRDLRIYAQKLGGTIHQYHDADGLEADAVIRLNDGRWAATEIKLGSDAGIDEGVKNLLGLKAKVKAEREPEFLAIFTAAQAAYRRSDDIFVILIACLKN
ncbi:MAG: DUF4143 domain-containing protein [Firmicutes bacterium]|nr:DUF4143 domain-containing protein [Bacillota bacterium]